MWKIKNKEAVSPVIGVILMVAITVVLAAVLYVWVSGFMTTTSGGVYALSTGTWSDSGSKMNASVISTTPTTGIKIGDITWQLYAVATGAVAALGTPQYYGVTGTEITAAAGDYLKAGCRIMADATATTGEYKIRAIVGGSQVYESGAFTITA